MCTLKDCFQKEKRLFSITNITILSNSFCFIIKQAEQLPSLSTLLAILTWHQVKYLFTFLLLKKIILLCIRFLGSSCVGIFICTKWTRAERIRNSFALKSTFPSVLIQECGGETNYKSPYFCRCFFLPTSAFTSPKASHPVIKRTHFGISLDSQLGSELMSTLSQEPRHRVYPSHYCSMLF